MEAPSMLVCAQVGRNQRSNTFRLSLAILRCSGQLKENFSGGRHDIDQVACEPVCACLSTLPQQVAYCNAAG